MQTSALKASENMCHSSCIPPLLLAALCLYLEVYAITFCAKAGSRRINQTQNTLLSNHTTFLLSNNFKKFDLEKRSFPPNGDLDMAFIAPGGKIALSFSTTNVDQLQFIRRFLNRFMDMSSMLQVVRPALCSNVDGMAKIRSPSRVFPATCIDRHGPPFPFVQLSSLLWILLCAARPSSSAVSCRGVVSWLSENDAEAGRARGFVVLRYFWEQ